MTDMTEPQADRRTEDADFNKSVVFAALAEIGIHSVTIDYDGSDDSGQIQTIEAWNAVHDKIPVPSSRKLRLASGNEDRSYIEMNLEAAIETLAYDYLEGTYPGWEINDGAFGTFVFNIPNRTITLEHRARFTDVDISTHQF
jgi:hypothetical protein